MMIADDHPVACVEKDMKACRREVSAHAGDENNVHHSTPSSHRRAKAHKGKMCSRTSTFQSTNPKSSLRSATLPATTLSTELYSSIPIAPTLVRAFILDTYGNCLFLSKDVELRTCNFAFELDRCEVDVVLVGLKPERRLDVATFILSKPSESVKSISLSKCPMFTNDRIVPQHLHVDQSDDVEITR